MSDFTMLISRAKNGFLTTKPNRNSQRLNPELRVEERMSYGVDKTMETNELAGSYYVKETREDSIFGKQVLRLHKEDGTFQARSCTERIPYDWKRCTVAIYHAYLQDFSMLATCEIKAIMQP